jgi:hypothetical protein
MQTWEEHIEEAERLLKRADDPNTSYDIDRLVAQAQVHATLAVALKDTVSVYTRRLPDLFPPDEPIPLHFDPPSYE